MAAESVTHDEISEPALQCGRTLMVRQYKEQFAGCQVDHLRNFARNIEKQWNDR